MDLFSVEILSPNGCLYKGEAEMVLVPAAEGEVGILAKHMQLITSLAAGEVKVQNGVDKGPVSFMIQGGYAQVKENTCFILAHTE